MHHYLELLTKCNEMFKTLSKETASMLHEMNQKRNDFESVSSDIRQKREELAKLELELKTRAMSFENGLSKINDDAIINLRKAEETRVKAEKEFEAAKRERAIAEQIRQDAEHSRKEVITVNSVRAKVRV